MAVMEIRWNLVEPKGILLRESETSLALDEMERTVLIYDQDLSSGYGTQRRVCGFDEFKFDHALLLSESDVNLVEESGLAQNGNDARCIAESGIKR
jgi:hypothetical protein